MLRTLFFLFTVVLQPKTDHVPTLHQFDVKNEFVLNNPTKNKVYCYIDCSGYDSFMITVNKKSQEVFNVQTKDDEQAICFINDCYLKIKDQ